MIYTNNDKKIAKSFLNCPIPESIKWNELQLSFDAMECYEALFDFAHCILGNYEIYSNFSCGLEENFIAFIVQLRKTGSNDNFCDCAIEIYNIVRKYI